ncbi:Serine/threonine-protein phosphatase 7 long form-like [Vitis vinifera]|uniref:Serine/threonine-protein phosphatase 7 long form-like n=1 Tax=Vitis vinifera TaxID=29760 RepID=A0A438JX39_VITVI|nr:Serine/threonine-protein phosphatase 7 long form-like [Vitis vinifera]
MHMDTIGTINQDALSWLEVIPFKKWALSHDGGRRYGIMTTNMSEVFNSEEYIPYVDAQINANVVKVGYHEVVLYEHFQGLFHVKVNRGSKKTSSGGRTYRVNLLMEHREGRSDPDPLDRSILVLQDKHRSQLVDSSQDVAMILGLRIDGPPITSTCDIDWSLLCLELLDVVPPPSQIRRSAISTQWLHEQFSHPPAGVDDVILQRYARAFILALLGRALFTDKTDTHGSAVLAYLYRELCRASLDSATEISGPITLLQRLHVGRPDFGRPPVPIVVPHVHDDVVDGLHDHLLPDEADEEIWQTMSPLICFDIIKWHKLEQVLRQFRMQQGIPPPCLIDMELYLMDRQGRHQYDWATFHAQYISFWATRSERIATTPLAITTMDFYDLYMQWYRRITQRLITLVLHRDHMRFHSIASATKLLMAISNDLEETHRITINVLRAIGEDHRVHSTQESSTSSGPSMRPPSLITPVRPSASLESPLSPPDVSIPAHSSRPKTTKPSTLTPIESSISLDLPFFPHVIFIQTSSPPPPPQPSISLDAPPPITESNAPPPITESIAPPPITESIAPPPVIESIAPLPFS